MIRSMMSAATGMEAQQLYMDTISNNLSNVNTSGYKTSKIEFQDLMYQTLKEPGVRNFEGGTAPSGIEVGLGVRPSATEKIFTQGSVTQTSNPLDIAIQGNGFFQITLPNGETAYTRDGTFKSSSDGSIVTSSGYYLSPQITVPQNASEVQISPDGKISVTLPGETTTTELGQLEVARFINPSGLKSLGGNLFSPTDASGEPIINVPGEEGAGTLLSGNIEASNVQVVEEMVNMISAQRAYEVVSKSIQVADEMLQVANNIKR